ncbi:YfcC family protein [Craterilacuibacter sinensis]|uniref:YfcC family protein n=1 Tax=Craterilacuibacter sinensis TaxID=2686017 RepID=A0A845BJV2_9NEIS|nr:AbgT family transporter [Craterilacuibacter sinensis]MXR36502.1 YfcC family protein [Craterilacuibacter sinensis]
MATPRSTSTAAWPIPDVYIILLGFILLMGLMTWLVPAGSYEREMRETMLGMRAVVLPGTYQEIAATPVGFMQLVTALPDGLSSAGEIVFMTLLVGGAVGVIARAGILDLGIHHLLAMLGARAELTIPILMAMFALLAAFIGTPELAIAYLPIILPLFARLGYDRATATATALLATSLGFTFGITAPTTVGVGQSIAGLPMFSGAAVRALIWAGAIAMCALYVVRHARRTRQPLAASAAHETPLFPVRLKWAALLTAVFFVALIAAIIVFGLKFNAIGGLFVLMAIAGALLAGRGPNTICDDFNAAFRDILVGALICGFARAIAVVMEQGQIADTIVHYLETLTQGMSSYAALLSIFGFQALFNLLVSSGSGQTILTMPVLVPLGDLLGISRQTLVLATQFGDGLTNLVFPTSGFFVATLAIGKVAYHHWLRFYAPLFVALAVYAAGVLCLAHALNFGPF